MSLTLDDDLLGPAAVSNPFEYFGRLRELDPVHKNEQFKLWVITRYDDVVWVTRHHELFSSMTTDPDSTPYPPIDEADRPARKQVLKFISKWVIHYDRPQHIDLRKAMHAFFTPQNIERWRPMVRQTMQGFLSQLPVGPTVDVKEALERVPLQVISRILGLPDSSQEYLRSLGRQLTDFGRPEPDRIHSSATSIDEMSAYFNPLLDDRLANPQSDFLTTLANGEKSGATTREQSLANVVFIVHSGHETSWNLLANGLLALAQHPEQWQLLRQDPAGRVRAATEECLRYYSPVKSIMRVAAQDVELRGKTIQRGERLRYFIPSANRDPGAFPRPDIFDVQRHPNTHVGFSSGIHHCLAATLARMQGQEFFQALAERFEQVQLEKTALEYHPSLINHSLVSLPVSFQESRR